MNPFCRRNFSNFNRNTAVYLKTWELSMKTGVQEAYAGRFKLEKAEYSDAKWFKEALKKPYYISDVFLGLRSKPHFIVSVKLVLSRQVFSAEVHYQF